MIEKHLIVISINDPIGLVNGILICCSGRQDSVQSPQFLRINRSFKSLTFWPLFCPFLSPSLSLSSESIQFPFAKLIPFSWETFMFV
jgi:hypothetical protein